MQIGKVFRASSLYRHTPTREVLYPKQIEKRLLFKSVPIDYKAKTLRVLDILFKRNFY